MNRIVNRAVDAVTIRRFQAVPNLHTPCRSKIVGVDGQSSSVVGQGCRSDRQRFFIVVLGAVILRAFQRPCLHMDVRRINGLRIERLGENQLQA